MKNVKPLKSGDLTVSLVNFNRKNQDYTLTFSVTNESSSKIKELIFSNYLEGEFKISDSGLVVKEEGRIYSRFYGKYLEDNFGNSYRTDGSTANLRVLPQKSEYFKVYVKVENIDSVNKYELRLPILLGSPSIVIPATIFQEESKKRFDIKVLPKRNFGIWSKEYSFPAPPKFNYE